jgi:hypothetical protein
MIDVQHRDWSESLAAARNAGGARLILTSPPYPDARTVEQYGGASFDASVEGYARLGEAVFEALMPGGVAVLNIDGPIRVWRADLGETERSLIAFEVALDWAKRLGFRYLEHAAYVRNAFPTSAGPRWKSGWEPIHIFAKPGAEPYFDRWGSTRAAKYAGLNTQSAGCRRKGERRRSSLKKWVQPDRRCLSTAEMHVNNQGTVDRDHAAPFASTLADDYVLCYSEPGSLVCDPFAGSGTVALSCHRHGRRFVGGDLGHRERDGRRWADIVDEACSQRTLAQYLDMSNAGHEEKQNA